MAVRLPELGTRERLEIEEIRERLHEAGYALRIHLIDERTWAAALHRFGLRSPATTSWEPGETPLDAARNAWSTFEHRRDLRSFLPDPAEIERRGDRYYFLEAGTLIIRKGRGGAPWRLAWLPSDSGETGFTLQSDDSPRGTAFPIDGGIPGVLAWATEQPWFPPVHDSDDDAPAE